MQVRMKINKDGTLTYLVEGAEGTKCLPVANALAQIAQAGTLGELCMTGEGEFDAQQTVSEQVTVGGDASGFSA
jgi:hypothetical protein